MKIRTALLALVGATLLSVHANAQSSTWAIDPAHSSVEFTIRHGGVSNVHGSLGGIKGNVVLDEKDLTKSSVAVTIDANSVNTNNDARDKHLKSPDFFDVAANPTLTFKSTGVTNAGGKLKLIGDLTIKGVTKSVTLDLDGPAPAQKGMGGKTVSGFSATGLLHREDFNFGTKFNMVLGNDVKFTVDIEMAKQ